MRKQPDIRRGKDFEEELLLGVFMRSEAAKNDDRIHNRKVCTMNYRGHSMVLSGGLACLLTGLCFAAELQIKQAVVFVEKQTFGIEKGEGESPRPAEYAPPVIRQTGDGIYEVSGVVFYRQNKVVIFEGNVVRVMDKAVLFGKTINGGEAGKYAVLIGGQVYLAGETVTDRATGKKLQVAFTDAGVYAPETASDAVSAKPAVGRKEGREALPRKQQDSDAKAHYPAPFGLRPGLFGWGARVTIAKSAKAMKLRGGSVESTTEGQELQFRGDWDKPTKQTTDIYVQGIGKAVMPDGRTVSLPILDAPTETFDEAVKLLSSGDFLERAKGAWILGELRDSRGTEHLRALANDPHWYVKRYAEQSLELLQAPPPK